MDSTKSRQARDETNPIAAKKSKIPASALRFFDESYFLRENLPERTRTPAGSSPDPDATEVDMSHPSVSPGLAPTSLLVAALPSRVAIYTCGWDQLLVEGDVFRDRVGKLVTEGVMSSVDGFVVQDTIHGFDKAPSFCCGNRRRRGMYGDAVRVLGGMWD